MKSDRKEPGKKTGTLRPWLVDVAVEHLRYAGAAPPTHFQSNEDTTMKIQIVKKADKKVVSASGCAWVIEQLPEPRK